MCRDRDPVSPRGGAGAGRAAPVGLCFVNATACPPSAADSPLSLPKRVRSSREPSIAVAQRRSASRHAYQHTILYVPYWTSCFLVRASSATFEIPECFKRFRHLRLIVVSFEWLSTFIMSPTLHRSKFPTALVSDRQIKYVAETDRDAEALFCSTECPVVLANAQVFRVFGTSKRPKVDSVSDVPYLQDVSDVLSDPNAYGALEVPGVSASVDVSDALDGSDVSNVQASDL